MMNRPPPPAELPQVALELEHSLGFTSNLQGIAFHPQIGRSIVLYGCGKLLTLSDLDDPHEQRLLRGHDATVSCVDISPSGNLMASGQHESIDSFTYFNVWDYETGEVKKRVQTGHKGKIETLRFSPDEALIATTGSEGSLSVWDTVTGKKISGYQDSITGDEAKALRWGAVFNPGTRNQKYQLFVPFNTGVRMCTLTFSIQKLAFEMECVACHVPGAGGRMGGYMRKYSSCVVIGEDVLCGSSSGDLIIFNSQTGNYQAALTLCANGVNALVYSEENRCVFAGGGDGKVKKLSGSGQNWRLEGELALEGSVLSMAGSVDDKQVVAMTNTGLIYRILARDLTYTVGAEAPLRGMNDIALSFERPELFASVSNDGIFRLWDLNDYTILSQFTLATKPQLGAPVADVPLPTSCAFDPDGIVITGWSDGRIRGLDTSTPKSTLAWTMSNGHKGKVHTVRVCDLYIVSAGEDSTIRVWSRSTKDFVTQMQDHKLRTTSVWIDNTTPSIVHSISLDMSHCAYDLSKVNTKPNVQGPRCISQQSFSGCSGFSCITQRRDNEHEVIIGTVDGRLLFFDLDYQQPVLIVTDKNRVSVTAVEVSPGGRYLVCGLADGSLVLYLLGSVSSSGKRLNTCDLLLHALCHSSIVVRCAFTSDSKQIISAGADGELILWNFFNSIPGGGEL